MAKEIKKGNKKVVAKPAAKNIKKAPARSTKVVNTTKKENGIIPVIYMFLLILGIALVFVSLTLKTVGEIDTRLMITCLGIALVMLIISAFIKKMNE